MNVQPGHGLKIINELSTGLQGRFERRFGSRGSTLLVAFPLQRHPHRVPRRRNRNGGNPRAEPSLDRDARD
jgi:hypothetical protein